MRDYDHIYLSPHLDDAALSCGGQIFQRTSAGQAVLIVTITAVDAPADDLSPTAADLHERWAASAQGELDAAEIVAQRRAEDEQAARILGADVLHWPYFDCIYRRHPETGQALYDSTPALFGPVDPSDSSLVDELAGAMATLKMGTLAEAARVYAPLGVGNHVDHQLTRAAAERAFSGLLYYEEYPYTVIPGALEAVLGEGERPGWQAEPVLLTGAALEAKIAAIMAFESQLSSFFAGPDDLDRQIRAEGKRALHSVGLNRNGDVAAAEVLWRRVSR